MKGEGHLEVYSASNRFSVPFSGAGKPPAQKRKKRTLNGTRKRYEKEAEIETKELSFLSFELI